MITITENLNNKKYNFKDVKTGTLFKVDNELCQQTSVQYWLLYFRRQ